MDLSKLTPNNWIAGGGGLVALINMFLPWYGVDFGLGSVNANAWDAGFLAIVGSLLAVAAGALIVLKALDIFTAEAGELGTEQLAMVLGAVGTLFLILKLLVDNDFAKFGLFLGVLCAIAVTAGAFLTGKDVGVGIPSADDFKDLGGGGGDGGTSTF